LAPTCCKNDVFVLGELLEAGISIDMQDAFEVRKRTSSLSRENGFVALPNCFVATGG
jgi:hypothetical protein